MSERIDERAAPGARDEDEGRLAVALSINGQRHALQIDPRMTLLDCLRETLHLTGTKKGCDHGQCGACTVHINGRRQNAAWPSPPPARGTRSSPSKGSGTPGHLHPMQAAFLEKDAYQCGYCTSGQIMSALALLNEPCGPSDDDVREFMSGNICRCGAYPNIVAAIQQVRAAELKRSQAMQTFEFLRPADAAAAIAAASLSPTAQQGASVRFLAGGTTLIDLMKLGVEAPERVVDINRLGLGGIERAGRRRPAHRRDRHEQRPRAPPGRARRAMRRCRRPSWPAPRPSCATPPRRPATCCSARAASTSATPPRPATSASRAPAARRSAAPTACSPSSAPARHCIATQSLGHGRGDAGLRRGRPCSGPAGRAAASRSRTSTCCRSDTARPGERARARRPGHACHAAPRRSRRARRPTSSSATAPPTSSRSSRPRCRWRSTDGKMTAVRFALGGVGTRPWRVPDGGGGAGRAGARRRAVPAGRRPRPRGRAGRRARTASRSSSPGAASCTR